ncbi:MAG: hypothetical protein OES32_17120 [Acidobacteriota bacterium]|nr:hypothetical protein [Acidobacteriota bacterium]MDH3525300.1 hypothetical protein [Acidobacteriota bacterium]
MIRGLRVWHRRWFTLLAVLLPVLLFFALRHRPTVPRLEALPSASVQEADPGPSQPRGGERP